MLIENLRDETLLRFYDKIREQVEADKRRKYKFMPVRRLTAQALPPRAWPSHAPQAFRPKYPIRTSSYSRSCNIACEPEYQLNNGVGRSSDHL